MLKRHHALCGQFFIILKINFMLSKFYVGTYLGIMSPDLLLLVPRGLLLLLLGDGDLLLDLDLPLLGPALPGELVLKPATARFRE